MGQQKAGMKGLSLADNLEFRKDIRTAVKLVSMMAETKGML